MINSRTGRQQGRAGFTLLELLVVVFIIVILVTLTVGASVRLLASFYSSTSKTTIQHVNSALQKQMTFILDEARKDKIPTAGTANYFNPPAPYVKTATPLYNTQDAYSLSAANNGVRNSERARIIHAKFRLQQYFPMTFSEALCPACGYPPVPAYVNFLAQYGITTNSIAQWAPAQAYLARDYTYESAICLYMILRYGPNATSLDEVGLSSAIKTVNVNIVGSSQASIPALMDAWSNPLMFCRWPVGNPTDPQIPFKTPANPQGAQPGFNDPQDPKGMLTGDATNSNSNWLQGVNALTFQACCHRLPPRSANNTAMSLNLTPVIASAGPDGGRLAGYGGLGLSLDPNDPNTASYPGAPAPGYPGYPFVETNPGSSSFANDNIYSTTTR
jgi:prepilin-type N-terminal cleavage/methylation domain-containing protein